MDEQRHVRRVLIVDDSATIRRMVRASLAALDEVTFTEAASGLEALEQLALEPVSLLILDLNMPDVHGLEVLQFVRANQAYRALPVIVLTTRGDESSRTAAVAAGANHYMTKPFAPHMLASVARDLMANPVSDAPTR